MGLSLLLGHKLAQRAEPLRAPLGPVRPQSLLRLFWVCVGQSIVDSIEVLLDDLGFEERRQGSAERVDGLLLFF